MYHNFDDAISIFFRSLESLESIFHVIVVSNQRFNIHLATSYQIQGFRITENVKKNVFSIQHIILIWDYDSIFYSITSRSANPDLDVSNQTILFW